MIRHAYGPPCPCSEIAVSPKATHLREEHALQLRSVEPRSTVIQITSQMVLTPYVSTPVGTVEIIVNPITLGRSTVQRKYEKAILESGSK